MSNHGNSRQNDKSQHLYGIYEWESNALFKYGISAGKIGSDGMSKRMRIQATFLNLGAGFNKFYAKILLAGIPGRATAERIEQEYIDAYSKKARTKTAGEYSVSVLLFSTYRRYLSAGTQRVAEMLWGEELG